MGCTHPLGVIPMWDPYGNLIGVKCPSCGRVAYKGESVWRALWRNLFGGKKQR